MSKPEIQMLKYSTAPLVAAIANYDATQPEREAMFNALGKGVGYDEAQAQFVVWNTAVRQSLKNVQMAFFQVTRDRNCLSNCFLADMDFMRKTAKGASEGLE